MTHDEIARKYLGKAYADCGKNDALRVDKAYAMIACNYKGDGLWGCIAELFTCGRLSRKDSVSGVNENDSTIRFREASGRIRYIPIERKTNGGRLGMFYENTLEDGCYIRHTTVRSKERIPVSVIVYSMDTMVAVAKSKKNPNGGKVQRIVEPVVIPVSVFLDFLEENGLLKSTNGKNPEPAIQVSSMLLYQALKDWPVVYDRTKTYSADDFEDLVLTVPPKDLWVK